MTIFNEIQNAANLVDSLPLPGYTSRGLGAGIGSRNGDFNKFIATIRKRGIAPNNRYETRISFNSKAIIDEVVSKCNLTPSSLNNLFGSYCIGVSIPDISLATTPLVRYGESIEIPYQRIYSPLEMTFLVDSTLQLRHFFEIWINNVIDRDANTSNFMKNYAGAIELYVGNKDSDVNSSDGDSIYFFDEVFPKSIGQISLSNNNNGHMELTVAFSYRRWYSTISKTTAGAKQSVEAKQKRYAIKSKGFKDQISDIANSINTAMNAFDSAKGMLSSLDKNIKKGGLEGAVGAFSTLSKASGPEGLLGGLFGGGSGKVSDTSSFADSIIKDDEI